MREDIVATWTAPERPLVDIEAYLADAEKRYVTDAYHSLSIEGYRVIPELIEKVRDNAWKPETTNRHDTDALAARGYSRLFAVIRGYSRLLLSASEAI